MNLYWLHILRPANVVTAVSDVLAGLSLAILLTGLEKPAVSTWLWIAIASMFLYAGGIVFNDVFDADIDAVERPSRPIPSGNISIRGASVLGAFCFTVGMAIAVSINFTAFFVAFMIVIMCLLYNAFAKHHFIFGPIVMGLCRAFNLLLGYVVLSLPIDHWYLFLFPVLYIAAITNISRGEVYGNNLKAIRVSVVLYSMVIVGMLTLAFYYQKFASLIFILFFASFIFKPIWRAAKTLAPKDIQNSVKMGVLGLIIMNAAWVGIGYSLILALLTLLLLPVSIGLSKRFKVT